MKAVECAVHLCPAWAEEGQMTCKAHRQGVLMHTLGLAKQKCTTCRRVFNKQDYVVPQRTENGYRHVACEPKKTRHKPEGMPLLEGADATDTIR